jgi:hypothetical protein
MGGRKWRYGTLSPFHISWDKSNDSKLNGLSDPKSQSLFSALSGLKMGTSSYLVINLTFYACRIKLCMAKYFA